MTPAAIELTGVRKTYGSVVAVHDLDLSIRTGSITGFLGPNGSGKTTTLRTILSIVLPDAGTVRVLGRPSALESRPRIGYIPEDRGLYKDDGVAAFLTYMARLKGVPSQGLAKRIAGWLDRVGLADEARAQCGTLSRGMQQKVQALAALVHDPDLLILDEPFSGLDPVNRKLLVELFQEQSERGATVVLCTHVLPHAEELCDHVVMMHRGHKVADAPLDALLDRGHAVLAWTLASGAPPDLAAVEAVSGVIGVTGAGRELRVEVADGFNPHELIPQLSALAPTRRIGVARRSLENAFLATVAEAAP